MLRRLVLAAAGCAFLVGAWVSQVNGYAIVLGKEVPLRAQAHGQVVWVIDQGTLVRKGDRVIELDATENVLLLREAEAELQAAIAEVDFERQKLQEDLAELRARQEEVAVRLAQESETVELRNAQAELDAYLTERTNALFEHQIVSEIDRTKVDHAERTTKLSVKTGSKVVQRRAAQMGHVNGAIAAHFRVAVQREELGRAHIATLESKVERYRRLVERAVVRAPVDGVISSRMIASGGDAKLGDVILSILDQSELSVAVFVPESELSNVALAVHEEVKVRFNSHPLRSVPAQVVERYATLSADRALDGEGFEQELILREGLVLASRVQMSESCPFELRPGMTGTVQLGRRNLMWPIQSAATGLSKVLGL
jgi:multidrug resistance efflux pump